MALAARSRTTMDQPYLGKIVGIPGVSINAAFVDLPGGVILELLDYQTPGQAREPGGDRKPWQYSSLPGRRGRRRRLEACGRLRREARAPRRSGRDRPRPQHRGACRLSAHPRRHHARAVPAAAGRVRAHDPARQFHPPQGRPQPPGIPRALERASCGARAPASGLAWAAFHRVDRCVPEEAAWDGVGETWFDSIPDSDRAFATEPFRAHAGRGSRKIHRRLAFLLCRRAGRALRRRMERAAQ